MVVPLASGMAIDLAEKSNDFAKSLPPNCPIHYSVRKEEKPMKPFRFLHPSCVALCALLIACSPSQGSEASLSSSSTSSGSSSEEETPSDAPTSLSKASWIWGSESVANSWLAFRKDFNLSTRPEKARVEIAIENQYRLSINGRRVIFQGGVKRGYSPTDGYFEEFDVSSYLQKGTNVILVEGWYWGKKSESYSNVPLEKAGFIFALTTEETTLLSDTSWCYAEEKAYKNDADASYSISQPNSRLPENNIYYDANEKEIGLDASLANYDAAAWKSAQIQALYGETPFGELHKSPLPLLHFGEVKDYLNSADYVDHVTSQNETLTLSLPANLQFTPYLKIVASAAGLIDIATENTVSETTVQTHYLSSDKGEQEFESPAWVNGQKAIYTFPAGITIKALGYRPSGYACEQEGEFHSDGAFYDTLWTMGKTTQNVCIRDGFMDCPGRERAQWCGDATTQMHTLQYTHDRQSDELYRKMIRQKMAWVSQDTKSSNYHLLPTVVPVYGNYYEVPAQEMAGIWGLWDFYTYSGDKSLLQEAYPYYLDYLKLWVVDEYQGLMEHKYGVGLPDWQDTGNFRVDTTAEGNAWYYGCLSTLKKMAVLLGEDTTWLADRMAYIEKDYEKLWISDVGYASSASYFDERANALAVLSGLAPVSRYPVIEKSMMASLKASSYMEFYVEEALAEMGYLDDCFARMKTRFQDMVSDNLANGYTTLWEYWQKKQGTLNHAWSAGVDYLLSRYIGGIRPLTAGYRSYEIVPSFTVSTSVSSTAQSVLGTIAVQAELSRTSFRESLKLPAGGSATIAVPLLGENDVITLDDTTLFASGKANVNAKATYVKTENGYRYFTLLSQGDCVISSTK